MPATCSICAANARSLGRVDFNKSCISEQGQSITPSGVSVEYHRCSQCGFIFTKDFDDWSAADFKQRIYNDDYILVDPDYLEIRPRNNAINLDRLFGPHKKYLRFIDFGGGNGALAEHMRGMDYHAETFDPFSEHRHLPEAKANVVTSFEVIEHAPRPKETLDEILALLEPEGVLIFSTLVQPPDIESLGLDWWYVAPRNGHVSLHSSQSLELLMRSRGLATRHFSDDVHFAYRSAEAPLARYLIDARAAGP
jgi:SAM-dependent methyltransferase